MSRFGALLFAGVFLLGACRSGPPSTLPKQRVALRLIDTSGEAFTLASLRGRPVLISIFTTWSDPALLEIPLLREIHAEHGKELSMVAIALDANPRMVAIFAQTFDLPYRVATPHDPARMTGPEGPFGPIGLVPTGILLDRDGRVVARMDGAWDQDVLRAAVRRLLGLEDDGS